MEIKVDELNTKGFKLKGFKIRLPILFCIFVAGFLGYPTVTSQSPIPKEKEIKKEVEQPPQIIDNKVDKKPGKKPSIRNKGKMVSNSTPKRCKCRLRL